MAILFDELDDYFSIADAAGLTLPDGDWCVAIWTRVTDNSGSNYQYLLSNNNWGVNNSFNLFLCEAGEASDPNEWAIRLVDGDGTTVTFDSGAAAPGADGLWRLVVVQRRTADAQVQMWFCTPGATPALVGSDSDTNFDAIDGGAWNVGRRVDGNANRYYGSFAAELFKGDFSLSQEEIAALGAGVPIYALGKSPSMYLVMGTSEATLRDLFGSNDATRSSAPTTAEHPPITRTTGAVFIGIGAEPPPPPPPPSTPASNRYARVLIGDRTGRIIAEVEPLVGPVSWRLNNVGRATLRFAKTDPKCTEDNLRFGNRVLIQFGNGLPDWGGVIDPPRDWTDESVMATAYSGESLLAMRQTSKLQSFSAATTGYIFQSLIEAANAVAATGITIGSIWNAGNVHSPEYHFDNLLKIIGDSLAERLGGDFAVLAAESGGYIVFTGNFYERRGSDKSGVVLLEDHNLAGIGLSEQGPIVNYWSVVGQGSTWGDERLVGTAQDADSVAEYGLRESSEANTDTTTQTTLDDVANNLLNTYAWPHNVLTLAAMDLAPAAFAEYDIGDAVRVLLHSFGFGGYDKLVRIIAREYDPGRGVCKLVVQEQ